MTAFVHSNELILQIEKSKKEIEQAYAILEEIS